MKWRFASFVVLLLAWCAQGFGQDVVLSSRASVTDYELGEAIVFQLDTSKIPEGAVLKGDTFPEMETDSEVWELREFPGHTYGLWGTPGKYKFSLLAMWGVKHPTVEGAWLDFGLAKITESVQVEGFVPPDPPDPPIPPPSGDIATAAQSLCSQIAGETVSQEAQTLAAMYESLAAEIETAKNPLSTTKLVTPEAAQERLAREASAMLGGRRSAWQVWYDGMKPVIDKQFADGELPNTVFGVGEVFIEIAKGLRARRAP